MSNTFATSPELSFGIHFRSISDRKSYHCTAAGTICVPIPEQEQGAGRWPVYRDWAYVERERSVRCRWNFRSVGKARINHLENRRGSERTALRNMVTILGRIWEMVPRGPYSKRKKGTTHSRIDMENVVVACRRRGRRCSNKDIPVGVSPF